MKQFEKYGGFLTKEMIAKLEVPRCDAIVRLVETTYPTSIDPAVLTDYLILGDIFTTHVVNFNKPQILTERWRGMLSDAFAKALDPSFHMDEMTIHNSWPVLRNNIVCRERIDVFDKAIDLFMVELKQTDQFVYGLIDQDNELLPFIQFLYLSKTLVDLFPG